MGSYKLFILMNVHLCLFMSRDGQDDSPNMQEIEMFERATAVVVSGFSGGGGGDNSGEARGGAGEHGSDQTRAGEGRNGAAIRRSTTGISWSYGTAHITDNVWGDGKDGSAESGTGVV